MPSISNLTSQSFDPYDDNDGQIVSGDAYENTENSKRDIANDIMKQIGGGKEYGFDLSAVVGAMVDGDMMDEIPDLQRQITNTNVRISSVGRIENLMDELQRTTLSPLSAGLSPYTITSSDPSSVIVSGDSNSSDTPKVNSFLINVDSLATRDAYLATNSQSSPHSKISGSGTLSIQVGSSEAVNISLSENSTLDSIAAKINGANTGVTASVVAGDDNSYYLALSSDETGKKNAITISNTATGDLGTMLNGLAGNKTQTAADASYSINGISMHSDSNNVKFDGVSLLLNKSNVSVTVSSQVNSEKIAVSVSKFVSNYNELLSKINDMTSGNPGKDLRGSLHGDDDISTLEDDFRNTLLSALPNGKALSEVGIGYNSDGTLSLNQSALYEAIDKDPGLADTVFATHLNASTAEIDPVSYSKSSEITMGMTQSGTYDVNITQLPNAASLEGNGVIPGVSGDNVTISSDVTLSLTATGLANPSAFDGDVQTISDITVNIPSGTYTKNELASLLQNQINHKNGVTENHADVGVSIDSLGKLVITGKNMGAQTGFTINSTGSTNLSELGLSGNNIDTAHNGQDVSGTINGQICYGNGQYLQAQDDETHGNNASGLVIKYTGSETGDVGTITFSKGYSEQLSHVIDEVTYDSGSSDTSSDGILARKLKEYGQDINKNNTQSLLQKLKEAEAKKEELTQMYFERYQGVNGMLSRLSGEMRYIDQLFDGKNN